MKKPSTRQWATCPLIILALVALGGIWFLRRPLVSQPWIERGRSELPRGNDNSDANFRPLKEEEPEPFISNFIDEVYRIPEYDISFLAPNNWRMASSTSKGNYEWWRGSMVTDYYRVGPPPLVVVDATTSNYPFLGCAIARLDSDVRVTLADWFSSYTKKLPWWDDDLGPGSYVETFDGSYLDGMRLRLYQSSERSEMILFKIGTDIVSVHYFIGQEGLNLKQYPGLDRDCETLSRSLNTVLK